MSISNASIGRASDLLTVVPNSISGISNSDDALTLLQAVHTVRSNYVLQGLKREIDSSSQYLNQLSSIIAIIKNFASLTSGPFNPVTVQSLKAIAKEPGSLRQFFSEDGPNLGPTLAAGTSAMEMLADIGVTINAPVNTPVLLEAFVADKNGVDMTKPPIRSDFSWYGEADLTKLERSTSTNAGEYPGSEVRTVTVKSSDGKTVEVQRYTVFRDYAMYRPAESEVDATVGKLQEKFSSIISMLSTRLLEIINGKEKLDSQIKKQNDEIGEQLQSLDDKQGQAAQVLIEFFRIIRQYRQEKDIGILKIDRSESGVGGENERPDQNEKDSISNASKPLAPLYKNTPRLA